MTDRELLELAAKAAGLTLLRPVVGGGFRVFEHKGGLAFRDGFKDFDWNPLTDDGDALRLAVRLRIEVWFLGLNTVQVAGGGHPIVAEAIYADGDPYAATRRAIVRAAAEIGRAMA